MILLKIQKYKKKSKKVFNLFCELIELINILSYRLFSMACIGTKCNNYILFSAR